MKSSTFFRRSTLSGLILGSLLSATQAYAQQDWLHVEGNQILDTQGNKVWLTGANWFGFNTNERIFHGLWSVNLENTLASITARGINILRVPISTQLLKEWQNGQTDTAAVNGSTNPDLVGASSLQVFDAMLAASDKLGLKILLDIHSAEADNMGHIYPLWYKGDISSEDFFSTLEWVTERYKNDDTIIAIDVENEPHGKPWADAQFAKWDNSQDENNWKYACETAANRILDINPNMLIMCEGIESYPIDGISWNGSSEDDFHNNWWGGNLRPVKDFPIDLGERQSQFMYSPHDYGPLVYKQPWFYEGFDKDSLYQDVWKDNWMFIHEQGIAPLLIGEWGGFMDGGDNEKWMLAIRDLIIEHGLHHTFWCINPNSGDTGGLLGNDWTTWDEAKYTLFEPSLWKNEQGKFIGLSHDTPLGSSATGLSLDEYYGSLSTSLSITSPQVGSFVTINQAFSVSYQLNKAAGVNVYLNDTLTLEGNKTSPLSLEAPSVEGEFQLKLVAVDDNGKELEVNEQLTLKAVAEIPLQPEIKLLSPSEGAEIAVGAPLTVQVALEDASGFKLTLDQVDYIVDGLQTQVTAPQQPGEYPLSVTALDADGQELNAQHNLNITVVEAAPSALSCELSTADAWDTGFVINSITLTNKGDTALNTWSAQLDFEHPVTITGFWSSNLETISEYQLIFSNKAWNGELAPGESVSFGLQGEMSGNFVLPTCSGQ